MGVDYQNYLGAYLLCFNGKIDKESTVNGCINLKCKQYAKDAESAFCSACGNPIGNFRRVEKHRRISDNLSFKAHKEQLVLATSCGSDLIPEYDIFLPNLYSLKDASGKELTTGIGWDRYTCDHGDRVQELDGNTADFHKTNFQNQYADSINALKKLYENGEVKWGIVLWAC